MKKEEKMEIIRHSICHLMSMAVQKLYPEVGLGFGPPIENGFYQDYGQLSEAFSLELLPKLEEEIKKMIKQGIKFEQHDVSFDEAYEYYKKDRYKTEILDDLKKAGEKKVSFYKSDWFDNLCKGPHVKSTKEINPEAFKLTKIAGAYWKGDEKNEMLTRIYGVAFETKEELDEYLNRLVEAEKRDHRKLGQELDLFIFSDLIGPGMPMYTFKGAILRKLIIDYSDELQQKIGYRQVHTPNMNKAELFKVSGHYDLYKNDMLRVKSNYSDEEYFLKPMNCPQHTQIYASHLRSYRDLPIRIADFANLYRDEKPGELSGLSRLRCFCQDDGHCFLREDQVEQEFVSILGIIKEALDVYGLSYHIRLSLWDPNKKDQYIGEEEIWEKSQKLLENLLKKNKIDFEVGLGEAAFYGPKMDIIAKDAIGREWQISTIQIDFNMPKRFSLKYIDSEGKEQTPVMIHRAIIGSPERFMSILIEHYAGAFPVWLSPVQVKIISVGSGHVGHCEKLAADLFKHNIRVEVDSANETVGNKIRKASHEKIPYMLVIGDKEMQSDKLHVRIRGEEKVVELKEEDFISKILEEVKDKK